MYAYTFLVVNICVKYVMELVPKIEGTEIYLSEKVGPPKFCSHCTIYKEEWQ